MLNCHKPPFWLSWGKSSPNTSSFHALKGSLYQFALFMHLLKSTQIGKALPHGVFLGSEAARSYVYALSPFFMWVYPPLPRALNVPMLAVWHQSHPAQEGLQHLPKGSHVSALLGRAVIHADSTTPWTSPRVFQNRQSRSNAQNSPRLCFICQSRDRLQDPSHSRLLTELNPKLNIVEGAKKTFLKRLVPFARVGNVGPQLFGCFGSVQPAAEPYSSHTCSSTCGCPCLWLKMCFLHNETGINNQSRQYVLL